MPQKKPRRSQRKLMAQRALAMLASLPPLPEITPGTSKIEVEKNGTRTLEAGRYGQLKVEQKGTLILKGGVYHFQSWEVAPQAQVYFLAPSEVPIAGRVKVEQQSYVGPAPSAPTLHARDLVVYVAGASDQDDDAAATFEQQTMVKVNVVAPNGTITLKQKVEATGAFLGKRVQVEQQVKLTLDSALGGNRSQPRPASIDEEVKPAVELKQRKRQLL